MRSQAFMKDFLNTMDINNYKGLKKFEGRKAIMLKLKVKLGKILSKSKAGRSKSNGNSRN